MLQDSKRTCLPTRQGKKTIFNFNITHQLTPDKMIFITQLIYIQKGQEAIFDQFEAVAIPAISKYNGQLLFRVRPADASFIEINMEKPYEIHLASFPSENDLENFMHDEDRQKFLHLKEQSIRSVMMIKGEKL